MPGTTIESAQHEPQPVVKYLDVRIDLGAETGQDTRASVQAAHGRLSAVQDRIRELEPDAPVANRCELLTEEAGLLIETGDPDKAWVSSRRALDVSIENRHWESAARACELMFRTEREKSLNALGQGIWLAVSFPVDPELTVALLDHVIEETPDDADGAAIAAAAAVYIVDLRAQGKQLEELRVHTRQALTSVARRHAGVQDQLDLDRWMERLSLTDVEQLLARLRSIVDVLVQEDWWFDWKSIQSEIPDH